MRDRLVSVEFTVQAAAAPSDCVTRCGPAKPGSASCDTLRTSASTLAYAYGRENRSPTQNLAEAAHAESAPDPAPSDWSICARGRPRRGRPGGHRQARPRGLCLALSALC